MPRCPKPTMSIDTPHHPYLKSSSPPRNFYSSIICFLHVSRASPSHQSNAYTMASPSSPARPVATEAAPPTQPAPVQHENEDPELEVVSLLALSTSMEECQLILHRIPMPTPPSGALARGEHPNAATNTIVEQSSYVLVARPLQSPRVFTVAISPTVADTKP